MMKDSSITLDILSPDKSIFSGEVSCVTLPGGKAPFTVLHNHASIISTLSQGKLSWVTDGEEKSIAVSGGFVEVKDNRVTVCVEV